MKKQLSYLGKEVCLFLVGGAGYVGVEMAYRGRSHPSMFLLGGFCFLLIGMINEVFPWDMPLISQMFISTILVTVFEFITGCIVNLHFRWDVWDYSTLPYNFLGQVCFLFTVFWFFLSLVAIFLDDIIRWKLFHEKKPKYHIFYSHCEDYK
jgi:uncharacterized membrane protein